MSSGFHKPVKNGSALWAIFLALAAFFFTFTSAVRGEQAAADLLSQVQSQTK
jgi:hypothetical protein